MTETPDLEAIARGVIDANRYMTIGTADESARPWVSPVWYATADYRDFFWVSKPEARHSRNLAGRPEVSIVIYDSHEAGGWKSVYLSATAKETSGGEVDRGIEIFSSGSVAQGLPAWTHHDVRPPARHRLYRATASELFVLSPGDERLPVDLRPA
jgi:nitroimidazol reductase NimA-like FMN-containing flavoprotein (pyridoxamine 5'-phosphate oxidase superfamily)